jgi:small subunit ribosomal protein S1
MDGLVHVSELSWKHVDHPSSVVSVGDEITVQVLDVDLDKERISLSLKATQSDPWQEFAGAHRVGELVYGRITKLVPFGAFVQVGDGIEGLVHISEMAAHHVDLPEQVVSPGEELWVKIIDIDLQRRRISLSIKQAAEGGEVAEEYREAFGEHAYDEQGNYIGYDYAAAEFTPETEAQAAWAEFVVQHGGHVDESAVHVGAEEPTSAAPGEGEPVSETTATAEPAEPPDNAEPIDTAEPAERTEVAQASEQLVAEPSTSEPVDEVSDVAETAETGETAESAATTETAETTGTAEPVVTPETAQTAVRAEPAVTAEPVVTPETAQTAVRAEPAVTAEPAATAEPAVTPEPAGPAATEEASEGAD